MDYKIRDDVVDIIEVIMKVEKKSTLEEIINQLIRH